MRKNESRRWTARLAEQEIPSLAAVHDETDETAAIIFVELVFPGCRRALLNNIFRDESLNRDGNPRMACSFRHIYWRLRLMEGADIYQIAKNCRTSVEKAEKFYASHIKATLDAAAINVKRAMPGPPRKPTGVVAEIGQKQLAKGIP